MPRRDLSPGPPLALMWKRLGSTDRWEFGSSLRKFSLKGMCRDLDGLRLTVTGPLWGFGPGLSGVLSSPDLGLGELEFVCFGWTYHLIAQQAVCRLQEDLLLPRSEG